MQYLEARKCYLDTNAVGALADRLGKSAFRRSRGPRRSVWGTNLLNTQASPSIGARTSYHDMLWRALRLPRHVPGLKHSLICTGKHRSLRTGSTPPSKIIDGQFTHSTPATRSIARPEILAPFSRAAELFRNPNEIPESARKREIKIGGIIRSVRKQKHASFAHISDGSTLAPIQVLLKPKLASGYVVGG